MTEPITVMPLQRMADPTRLHDGAMDHLAERAPLIPTPDAAKLMGSSRPAAPRWSASSEVPIRHPRGRASSVTAKRKLGESA